MHLMLLEHILPSVNVLRNEQVLTLKMHSDGHNCYLCDSFVSPIWFWTSGLLYLHFRWMYVDTQQMNTMNSVVCKTIQNTSEEGVHQYYLHICKRSDKIYTLSFNNHDCSILHVSFSKCKWPKHYGLVFCTATSYPGCPTFECWHETQTPLCIP
jgi:hypothetical protein